MSDVIRLVQGDGRPGLTFTIADDVTGTAIDLSDPTTAVLFKFRAAGTTTILTTVTCSKVGDGSTGQAQMQWPAGSLDVDPGEYEGEVSVDFNGQVQSLYEVIRFRVRAQF